MKKKISKVIKLTCFNTYQKGRYSVSGLRKKAIIGSLSSLPVSWRSTSGANRARQGQGPRGNKCPFVVRSSRPQQSIIHSRFLLCFSLGFLSLFSFPICLSVFLSDHKNLSYTKGSCFLVFYCVLCFLSLSLFLFVYLSFSLSTTIYHTFKVLVPLLSIMF